MDTNLNRKECRLRGRTYSSGEQVAASGGICYCIEGKWEPVLLVSGI